MWKFDESRPIYKQILEKLTLDIVSGKYPVGEKFPSVRELAVEAQVNPNTMQKALAELEQMGYLESRRGGGGRIVVQAAGDEQRAALVREKTEKFLAEMYAMGISAEEVLKAIQEETGHD